MGLAFTFFDRSYNRSLTDPDIDNIVEKSRHSAWGVLIDDKLYCEPGENFVTKNVRANPASPTARFTQQITWLPSFPMGKYGSRSARNGSIAAF